MNKRQKAIALRRLAESIRCDLESSAVGAIGRPGWYHAVHQGNDYHWLVIALRDLTALEPLMPFTLENSKCGEYFRLVDR